jgi:uncharacterized protein YjiS (DUF1127 family)
MTAVTATRVAAASGVTASLAAAWARLVAWRRREAAVAATFAELSALTDRELADIGFHRADLRRVAREAHQD